MKISVVIPTYNEGPDLLATVGLACASEPEAHEIIVVDDCSDIAVADRLSSFPQVQVHRNSRRLGSGLSKRHGVTLATGDVAVVLDAHMRMPMEWLATIADACERYPSALMCSVSRGFEAWGAFIGAGASLGRGGDSFALGRTWQSYQPNMRGIVDTIPCIFGACYIIPKVVWDGVGDGWNPNLYGWGFEEQDLSIRAWLDGFEVRRIWDLITLHRYKRPMNGYFMNSWESFYNQLVITASLFEDGVFEEKYYPYLKQITPSIALERFEEEQSKIRGFRRVIQSKRVYEDGMLEELCGFHVPTQQEQEEDLVKYQEKQAGV